MKKLFQKTNALFPAVFLGLLLLFPFAVVQARIQSRQSVAKTNENIVTVSVSLDSIKDIDGCDPKSCKYWQIHFQEWVGDWGRYYSSDVFSADQLTATSTFQLPAGKYAGVLLMGYSGATTGYCNFVIPGDDADSCPDGKKIIDQLGGLVYISEQDSIKETIIEDLPLVIEDTTPSHESFLANVLSAIASFFGGDDSSVETSAPETEHTVLVEESITAPLDSTDASTTTATLDNAATSTVEESITAPLDNVDTPITTTF